MFVKSCTSSGSVRIKLMCCYSVFKISEIIFKDITQLRIANFASILSKNSFYNLVVQWFNSWVGPNFALVCKLVVL